LQSTPGRALCAHFLTKICGTPPNVSPTLYNTGMMNKTDAKTLARLRREDGLADLRDGRKRRAVRIESAKRYKRKPKHRKGW